MSTDNDNAGDGAQLNESSETATGRGAFAMTHAEIAAVLGCSRQLVQQLETSAIAKLRAALGSDATCTMRDWGRDWESRATRQQRWPSRQRCGGKGRGWNGRAQQHDGYGRFR